MKVEKVIQYGQLWTLNDVLREQVHLKWVPCSTSLHMQRVNIKVAYGKPRKDSLKSLLMESREETKSHELLVAFWPIIFIYARIQLAHLVNDSNINVFFKL